MVRRIVAFLCVNRWSRTRRFGAGPAEGREAGSVNSDGLRHPKFHRDQCLDGSPCGLRKEL